MKMSERKKARQMLQKPNEDNGCLNQKIILWICVYQNKDKKQLAV